MSEEIGEGWLLDQVMASAGRLTNRPASLLSPTARTLKADVEAWIEASSFATRSLRVVHHTTEPDAVNPPQLPLITSVPNRPTR